MIVCHCHGVSDRAVRRSVREGATSGAEVARACGAGACCGGCRETVEQILDEELRTRPHDAVPVAVPLARAS